MLLIPISTDYSNMATGTDSVAEHTQRSPAEAGIGDGNGSTAAVSLYSTNEPSSMIILNYIANRYLHMIVR